jgi:rhamnosyltransferase
MDAHRPGVCAIVVTFNPPPEIGEILLQAARQSDSLIVVDNNSRFELRKTLESIVDGISKDPSREGKTAPKLLSNSTNLGLAEGMNQGLRLGLQGNCALFLFLDQDSLLLPGAVSGLVEGFLELSPRFRLGAVVATNLDANKYLVEDLHVSYARRRHGYHESGFREVFWWKTSGTLIPKSTLEGVGEFRSDFFIDSIDHEYCYRLRSSGYRIFWVTESKIEHRLGDPVKARFGPFRINLPKQQSWRYYYITRNPVWIAKRYLGRFKLDLSVYFVFNFSLVAVSWIFQQDRRAMLGFIGRGVLDGLRSRMGGTVLPH